MSAGGTAADNAVLSGAGRAVPDAAPRQEGKGRQQTQGRQGYKVAAVVQRQGRFRQGLRRQA